MADNWHVHVPASLSYACWTVGLILCNFCMHAEEFPRFLYHFILLGICSH